MPSPPPPGIGSPISVGDTRRKILGLDELAAVAERLRRSGARVVQAHGTFDLVHLGHVKHLEAARRHGDALFVTLTADRFVNKGPGRPVFSQTQRAEMLAALAVVDHVAVVDHADAVTAIRALRPSVYVKGADYADAHADVTGKIVDERRAVEAAGGALVITDEPTLSSTALLNRAFDLHEPRLRATLHALRAAGARATLLDLLERVRGLSVLVVGDAILDEYTHVEPMAKAGKEALVATRRLGHECFAGGVFATANHAAAFCRAVDVVTCIGDDDPPLETARRPNVTLSAHRRPGAPTTRKQRFVDPSLRKLFEVYVMDDGPLDADTRRAFDADVARRAGEVDVVIANDFGHGLIAPLTIELLTERARFLAVNTQTNAGNHGYNLVHKYPRADYVCLDAEEARLAAGDQHGPLEDIVTTKLGARLRCDRFIVTQGKRGCVTSRGAEVPGIAAKGADTMGAGDAFLAITAPLVAAGAPLELAAFAGNVVGALKTGIVGHRGSVERVDTIKAITALLG